MGGRTGHRVMTALLTGLWPSEYIEGVIHTVRKHAISYDPIAVLNVCAQTRKRTNHRGAPRGPPAAVVCQEKGASPAIEASGDRHGSQGVARQGTSIYGQTFLLRSTTRHSCGVPTQAKLLCL